MAFCCSGCRLWATFAAGAAARFYCMSLLGVLLPALPILYFLGLYGSVWCGLCPRVLASRFRPVPVRGRFSPLDLGFLLPPPFPILFASLDAVFALWNRRWCTCLLLGVVVVAVAPVLEVCSVFGKWAELRRSFGSCLAWGLSSATG